MGIKLVHRRTESSIPSSEFQGILDTLASLYANDVAFKYDAEQASVVVSKAGRILGNVRAEGALHTIIWATLSLAEKEA